MARKWSNLNLSGALHYVTGNFLDRKEAGAEGSKQKAVSTTPKAKDLRPTRSLAFDRSQAIFLAMT